jgi:hypothetical protein
MGCTCVESSLIWNYVRNAYTDNRPTMGYKGRTYCDGVAVPTSSSSLFSHMPSSWRDMISEDLPQLAIKSHLGVLSRKTDTHIPISTSSNRQMYHHLLQDCWGKDDLLATFQDLCFRDDISLEDITSTSIWKGVRQAGIDYPKFSDLFWLIILGKVRTGESWMSSTNCPICRQVQVTEHLFWNCTAAKRVWQTLRDKWYDIAGVEVDLSTTWAGLLLLGVHHDQNRFGDRFQQSRWRILFSEALWSIWSRRCAWSFGEIPAYKTDVVLAYYENRVTLRIQIDRQLALDKASDDCEQSFEKTGRRKLEE